MKPLLKWVGGKTQIINSIIQKFPKEINNYHEIFVGGGSVLIKLLEENRLGNIKIKDKIYAYDINFSLIRFYKDVKENPELLFTELEKIKEIYNKCDGNIINRKPINIQEAITSKESYYYWIRMRYNKENKNNITSSAMFLFINKTCFRGLYRESKNGFNVPFGNYKNPDIVNKEHLLYISDLIKDVNFECLSFEESIIKPLKNDFMYLDPPYLPEKKESFVKYTKDDFSLDKHYKLFEMVKKSNILFIMSNASVKLIYKHFKDEKYKIEDIICKRKINSKNPKDETKEVIISLN